MDEFTRQQLDNIRSQDRELRNRAFLYLLEVTEKPVDWAYEAWDELVAGLKHKDNHVRAICAQVLANLAISDPQNRILEVFDELLAVTRDERFVTARHCMQSIWKVGTAGPQQRKIVVDGLELRFDECIGEKNCTLIRYDIVRCLRELYDEVGDECIKEKAFELIESEQNPKYRVKYSSVWRAM